MQRPCADVNSYISEMFNYLKLTYKKLTVVKYFSHTFHLSNNFEQHPDLSKEPVNTIKCQNASVCICVFVCVYICLSEADTAVNFPLSHCVYQVKLAGITAQDSYRHRETIHIKEYPASFPTVIRTLSSAGFSIICIVCFSDL